jgi:ArsR family transcriptional regulator
MGNIQRLFSALSDNNRLRIIAALKVYGDMCACQVVELLQVTGATTSKHLSILIQVGLIDSYKEGRWVHYRLDYSSTDFDQVMGWLENKLSQTDIIKSDKRALKEIMTVDREEICRKQRGEKCCPK